MRLTASMRAAELLMCRTQSTQKSCLGGENMALVLSFRVQSVLYAVGKNCINQLHKLLKVCQVQKNEMGEKN